MREADGEGGWARILFKPMACADNYVPADFLSTLLKPGKKKKRLSLLVLHALAVVQQFSAVVLFGLVFSLCRYGGSALLYTADVVLLATGLLISNVARRRLRTGGGGGGGSSGKVANDDDDDDDDDDGSRLFGFPLCLVFATLVSMASPVLRTLTDSYSSDTIYALATGLAAVHIVAHDYEDCSRAITATMVRSSKDAAAAADAALPHERGGGKRPGEAATSDYRQASPVAVGLHLAQPQLSPQPQPLSGVLSSNAAIFGCVLLASRLPSDDLVFGLVMLAVELFALLPTARRRLCAASVVAHVAASAVLVVVTALGLAAPRGLLVGAAHRALHAAVVAAVAAAAAAGSGLSFFAHEASPSLSSEEFLDSAAVRGEGGGAAAAESARPLVAYLSTVTFLAFVCPCWLLFLQRHKRSTRGPWDIAQVSE